MIAELLDNLVSPEFRHRGGEAHHLHAETIFFFAQGTSCIELQTSAPPPHPHTHTHASVTQPCRCGYVTIIVLHRLIYAVSYVLRKINYVFVQMYSKCKTYVLYLLRKSDLAHV